MIHPIILDVEFMTHTEDDSPNNYKRRVNYPRQWLIDVINYLRLINYLKWVGDDFFKKISNLT